MYGKAARTSPCPSVLLSLLSWDTCSVRSCVQVASFVIFSVKWPHWSGRLSAQQKLLLPSGRTGESSSESHLKTQICKVTAGWYQLVVAGVIAVVTQMCFKGQSTVFLDGTLHFVNYWKDKPVILTAAKVSSAQLVLSQSLWQRIIHFGEAAELLC